MNALVGYTGFVGSNLYSEGSFDAVYHSKNIEEAFGTKPDLLVYSGLRAEKYLANQAPERDMELILQAEENISRISPKKLVAFLLERKYLYRDKRGKLLPYEEKNQGLFEVKECVNEKTQWSGTQTLVTPKGRETFRLLYVH